LNAAALPMYVGQPNTIASAATAAAPHPVDALNAARSPVDAAPRVASAGAFAPARRMVTTAIGHRTGRIHGTTTSISASTWPLSFCTPPQLKPVPRLIDRHDRLVGEAIARSTAATSPGKISRSRPA
jgi:hypothetical protein